MRREGTRRKKRYNAAIPTNVISKNGALGEGRGMDFVCIVHTTRELGVKTETHATDREGIIAVRSWRVESVRE